MRAKRGNPEPDLRITGLPRHFVPRNVDSYIGHDALPAYPQMTKRERYAARNITPLLRLPDDNAVRESTSCCRERRQASLRLHHAHSPALLRGYRRAQSNAEGQERQRSKTHRYLTKKRQCNTQVALFLILVRFQKHGLYLITSKRVFLTQWYFIP